MSDSDLAVLVEAIRRMQEHEKQLRERVERLEVQLAGCGVAALGGTKEPAKRTDWGWSASYQDVLDLRIKYEEMQEHEKQAVRKREFELGAEFLVMRQKAVEQAVRKREFELGAQFLAQRQKAVAEAIARVEYWKSRYLLLEKTYEEDIRRLKEK